MTPDSRTELRLVLLGRPGAGKSSVGNTILGRRAFLSQPTSEGTVTQGSEKHRGSVSGRQVAVVDTPDCFCSERPPEDVRCHVSSCVALSTPGPHAFLLCVPVDRPVDAELRALVAMERVFGPAAVSGHTVILFTHTDKLEEGQQLEEYIAAGRKDLLELVEKCGDRYHTLKRGSGEEEEEEEKEEERKSVEELLEKVEQTVKESGTEFYSCPLYQEAEESVRERQKEIARQRREGTGGGEEIQGEETDPSVLNPEREIDDEDDEEEMEKARDEAERSVNDLDVDGCVASLSPSSPPPSFLWSLWEKVIGWMRRLPKMVRREALLGAFVGLFVGGPFGGMLGATVGSVATEVGRRKTLKTDKNK